MEHQGWQKADIGMYVKESQALVLVRTQMITAGKTAMPKGTQSTKRVDTKSALVLDTALWAIIGNTLFRTCVQRPVLVGKCIIWWEHCHQENHVQVAADLSEKGQNNPIRLASYKTWAGITTSLQGHQRQVSKVLLFQSLYNVRNCILYTGPQHLSLWNGNKHILDKFSPITLVKDELPKLKETYIMHDDILGRAQSSAQQTYPMILPRHDLFVPTTIIVLCWSMAIQIVAKARIEAAHRVRVQCSARQYLGGMYF